MTHIERYAFYSCKNLESVTIPSSVTEIGDFAYCDKLSAINVDENNEYYCDIDGVLFTKDKKTLLSYPGGGATVYTVPSSTDTVGPAAFSGCDKLTSITVPSGVKNIGWGAFGDCVSLASIMIADSVTSIGQNIVSGTAYYFDTANWENGCVLYIGNHLIETKYGISEDYIVKEGTVTIADSAFAHQTELKSVLLPESLKGIGGYAFDTCIGLTEIIIPEAVTCIDICAFDDCRNLTKITIGDNITYIGNYAFRNSGYYNDLANWENELVLYIGKYLIDAKDTISGSYTVKNGTKVIANQAFNNSKSLTDVTIPEGVMYIGNNAFNSCSGLVSVEIPSTLKSISDYAFSRCSTLEGITLPESLTKLGSSAFESCLSLNNVIIPSSITVIEDSTFSNCYALTSVIISSGVTEIGQHAFGNCESLGGIRLPNSIKKIGDYAFAGCRALTSVTIPDNVTSIGSEAFAFCSSLMGVTVGDGVKKIGDSAFQYCGELKNLKIGINVTHIGNYTFFECSSLESLNLPSSLMTIGDKAFESCYGLTKLTIPNNVTSIGEYAFTNCTYLTSVTLGNSLTSIGDMAFLYCTELKSISFPSSVKHIGDSAFFCCSSLENITIPSGVKSIGDSTFSDCYDLTSVTFESKNVSIGSSAFDNCTLLGKIYLYSDSTADEYFPDKDYEKIYLDTPTDKNTFEYTVNSDNYSVTVTKYNGNVDTVVIPYTIDGYSVTAIGAGAFASCGALVSVTVPRSVEHIGGDLFNGCTKLEAIWVYVNSYADSFYSESKYADLLKYPEEFEKGDIKLEGVNGSSFTEGAALNVTEVPETELGNFGVSNEHGKKPDIVAYDITLEVDGEETQPNGFVTVRIKVPSNFNGKRCKVYHYAADGTVTDMEAEYSDGYMVFRTDHFSVYILADMSDSTVGDVNGDGGIDSMDAVLLAQFLAKWSVEINESAADCNGDGFVDTMDAVLLAQYLAKWNVTLG